MKVLNEFPPSPLKEGRELQTAILLQKKKQQFLAALPVKGKVRRGQ